MSDTVFDYRARLPGPAKLTRVNRWWLARCGRVTVAAAHPGVALARLAQRFAGGG